MQSNDKADPTAHLESLDNADLPKEIDKTLAEGDAVQMRSDLDNLPILKAVRIYWRIATICMMAAFSAALEGYRMLCRLEVEPSSPANSNSRACAYERHRLK